MRYACYVAPRPKTSNPSLESLFPRIGKGEISWHFLLRNYCLFS
jgi:hypothetical protein